MNNIKYTKSTILIGKFNNNDIFNKKTDDMIHYFMTTDIKSENIRSLSFTNMHSILINNNTKILQQNRLHLFNNSIRIDFNNNIHILIFKGGGFKLFFNKNNS